MSTTTSCPTPEQVEDLLANRLTIGEANTLRLHLSTCPLCQAKANPTPGNPGRAATYPFLSPAEGADELGRLDDHRILGVLGEGGMSIVFDAEDTNLSRRVALKVLKPRTCDPNTRKRFLQEGKLLAGLPHEHVVTIFQVGEANGIPYLTMERLEGSSLEDRLKHDKWLPVTDALLITREAAEGLVAAHEAGLVHRDIKPANIWLETRDYRFRRVKLIDFGIARMVNQESSLTSAGTVLGTPMYMAPEQAQGKPVDGRADLYSLGCVLFHTLTGRPPFAGKAEDTMAVLASAIAGETPKVRLEAPQLPAAVAELIQQLLSRDREQRPPSARALVERLKQFEAEKPSAPVAPSTLQATASRRLMRRPGLVGIWLGILTISAALLVGAYQVYQKLATAGKSDTDAAVSPDKPAGEPWKIGVLHSQTGPLSVHERPILKATELAAEEINRAGGVLGRPIELVIEDGGSDDAEFAEKARKLIEEDKVIVLFGCWSSAARKNVAEVCRQHDRLLFYSVAYEGLENSPNVVYLGGTPNQTLLPLVRWAYADKGKRRFFLIGSDEVFTHSVEAILAPEIKRLGAELVGARYVPAGETQFAGHAAAMKEKKADLLLNTVDGSSSNEALLQALRKAGLRPGVMETVWDSVSEAELWHFRTEQMVGDYSVGCYFESLTRPENKAFVERYRKRFGARERVNDPMQTAYFGVYLWKNAVEKASDGHTSAVRQALRGLTVEAPEGTIRIDEKYQHAYRTARVGEIVDVDNLAQFEIVSSSPRPLAPDPFPAGRSEKEWKTFLDGLFEKLGGRWERQP